MSKQYSSSHHVLSTIWGVTEAAAFLFMHEIQLHYQLLDGILGPLHSHKRKNPIELYRQSEGAKGFVHPAQSICLEKFYSGTLSM
jgi:hypothetical protein